MTREKEKYHNESNEVIEDLKSLVLYNDDYNSFDFVIDTLIEICKHTPEQAEQCALITHYRGKCSIKEGEYEKLKPLKEEINKRGLNSVIE